jgi:uncharacterized protein YecE (DUF72 family)
VIHVGTCSWTEKTLIKSGEFYPKDAKTAESRLRYYAGEFDTVEVDSTYYALPDSRNTYLWVHRTPVRFTFHIKVYGALTGHGVDPKTLPRDIQGMLSGEDRAKTHIYIKEPLLREAIAERFRSALAPLAESGKLGVLVYQFPPWFQYNPTNLDFIIRCQELMGTIPIAVEFRHGSWLTPQRKEQVLRFLREHHFTYITVDEPQYGTLATIPFIPCVTAGIAYFRFHGRNRENWLKKGIETSLRFAYEYSDNELEEFIPAIMELHGKANQTFVMFNNCHLGFAVRNAQKMREMLQKDDAGGRET